ncbi:ATP-binding protein [Sphaerisporangium sp. NPDC051011]|uniref:ATP-binding protein n=1 Tax=Sphaerisporangium sp. NPDC051011 TaxID=3155792 RepID=UPI0033DFCF33
MSTRDDQPRPGGRHRKGAPATRVEPGRWDLVDQAAARQIDMIEPTWAVWYGVGTRHFYAVATWPTPEPLLVHAGTTDELRGLMRAAERTLLYHPRTGRALQPAAHRPDPSHNPTPPDRASLGPATHGALMPETQDGVLRTVCWDLPDDLSMIGKARGMVKEVLTAWALPDLADDVVLAVGELLANALTYGRPPVRLSLWLGTADLCVRVTDHGPERPRHLNLDIEAVHGRGLAIVEALAHDTGVTPLPDSPGKTVWARWHLPPRAAEVPHSTTRSSGDLHGQPEEPDGVTTRRSVPFTNGSTS